MKYSKFYICYLQIFFFFSNLKYNFIMITNEELLIMTDICHMFTTWKTYFGCKGLNTGL